MSKGKVPAIRFKGFEDDWEQRKLRDYLTVSRVLGHTGEEAKKLTVKLWGKGVVEKTDKIGGSENTQYYIRHTGQFMYGKLDFLHAAFGIVPENLDNYESTLDSPAFDLHGIDAQFLLNRVTQEDFYLKNGLVANGSRKAKRIHEDTFLDMSLRVPSYSEQHQVGEYFKNLDDLITLHRRELQKLNIIKKSMLENCFPKNGEKVPRFRFSGFFDDWEQRKLSDLVGMTYGGGTPATSNESFWNGDIPWIQSSNTVEGQLFEVDVKKHISKDGLNHSAAQMVPKNSVAVVTHVGVGKLIFMPYSYTTSQDFISLSDCNCNPKFLCYSLYRKLQEDLHIVQGSAIKGITKNDLMEKQLAMPTIEEQMQITNALESIDKVITLHQRELEKFEKIKTSMLKSMFI